MSREPSLSVQNGLVSVAVVDGDTKSSFASRPFASLEARGNPEILMGLTGACALSLIFYAVLLSIPFLPGVEIGPILLMSLGFPAASYLYRSTIASSAQENTPEGLALVRLHGHAKTTQDNPAK